MRIEELTLCNINPKTHPYKPRVGHPPRFFSCVLSGPLAKFVSTILVYALLVACAFPHDLYLIPDKFFVESGAMLVASLRNGDSFPNSEISPVLARVRDVRLVSSTGNWDLRNLKVAGKEVRGRVQISTSGGMAVIARTIPFAFTLKAREFE